MSAPGSDPGQRLGPYRIEGELGRGGMGVVYLAQDPELGRRVALKVLRRASPTARQRLLLEARASAAIRHPNVVRVHDVRELEGNLVLVMDYVEGVNLGERLGREGAIPPREAARLATDLARALAAGHGRRILHRDVKPDNVLLREHDGAALLTDFGLAKFQDEAQGMTQSGVLMGTPLYAAPEQLSGGKLDARSDVYSLGALLFTMLTGEPPIGGDSLVQIVARVCSEPAPAPSSLRPEVPAWLDAICLQCLAKEPADRFPSAGELAQALQQGERGSFSSASREGAPARRRNALVGGVALLGALVALACALWVRGATPTQGDPQLAELTAPPAPGRPLDLALPPWARRAPAQADAEAPLWRHVAARRALLSGGPIEGDAPGAPVLQALEQLGWGREPSSAPAEGSLAALPAARATLAAAAAGAGPDPWARWARAVASLALAELDALEARVERQLEALEQNREPLPPPNSAWATLERERGRQARRARGLALLRALREGLDPARPLTPDHAREVRRLAERFFPETRATTAEEHAEFAAWLGRVARQDDRPPSFEELFEVLPPVLLALAPRMRLAEIPPQVLLRARAAVEIIYAGYTLTGTSPPLDVMLLGTLVGTWPVSRIRRMRPDLIAKFDAEPRKTGEHYLTLYVAVSDEASAQGEDTTPRLMDYLGHALGPDLEPSWRERFQLSPPEPLARPLGTSWVPYVKLRLLLLGFGREVRHPEPLPDARLDTYLAEFHELVEANRHAGLEPRLGLLGNDLAKRLRDYAARHSERADELYAFVEELLSASHTDTLAYLQGEAVFETFVQTLREDLATVTLDLARLWLQRGDAARASELLERTLEAWADWDPSYELLAYRCWVLALTGDPAALEACARERARIESLPPGSAVRPNAYRSEIEVVKGTLFAAELVAHLQAGELAAAEALAATAQETWRAKALPELTTAYELLARARKQRRE